MTDRLTSVSLLKSNPETAARVKEIMGLPNDNWSDIQIQFGLNEFAEVRVTFIPTGEQVHALAWLAIHQLENSCAPLDDGIECPNCTIDDREDCQYPEGH